MAVPWQTLEFLELGEKSSEAGRADADHPADAHESVAIAIDRFVREEDMFLVGDNCLFDPNPSSLRWTDDLLDCPHTPWTLRPKARIFLTELKLDRPQDLQPLIRHLHAYNLRSSMREDVDLGFAAAFAVGETCMIAARFPSPLLAAMTLVMLATWIPLRMAGWIWDHRLAWPWRPVTLRINRLHVR